LNHKLAAFENHKVEAMKQKATLIRARFKTPHAAAIAGVLFSVLLSYGPCIVPHLPVVGTFQAAGAVAAHLFENFGGRVGQFANQPSDRLLDSADLVITIGYDPMEYPPADWNRKNLRKLIHVDVLPADLDNCYRPHVELTGDISSTLNSLTPQLKRTQRSALASLILKAIGEERAELNPSQPLAAERRYIRCDWSPSCSISSVPTSPVFGYGSFHLWLGRHLYSFKAQQISLRLRLCVHPDQQFAISPRERRNCNLVGELAGRASSSVAIWTQSALFRNHWR
jgi:hypothetical protein